MQPAIVDVALIDIAFSHEMLSTKRNIYISKWRISFDVFNLSMFVSTNCPHKCYNVVNELSIKIRPVEGGRLRGLGNFTAPLARLNFDDLFMNESPLLRLLI